MWDYFTCGGFGEDGADRKAVAAFALAQAERLHGRRFARRYVIGDTVHDVACGRAIGAYTIAVKTGFGEWDRSPEIKPDRLVENLAGLEMDKL